MPEVVRIQHTIARPITLEGFGFWTGKDIRVEFHPALPGTGVVFIRTDLPGEPQIPASVEYQIKKPRQTSLRCGDAQVDMVEHLLAALYGLNIDNCKVCVNQPEMPGFDGSSRVFASALIKTGISPQPARRPTRIVYKKIKVGDNDHWIEVRPSYTGKTSFVYHLDYPQGTSIPSQSFRYVFDPENFITQLVSCRTFLMKEEADQLLAAGKCQRVTTKDVLVFDENGPIDNTLLFPDECVRHKLLDMIGDFSLGQCDWVGEFIAYRSGHQMSADCVRALLKDTVLIETDVVPVHENSFAAKV